ncbi:ABC transporter permease [Nocardioides sp. LHD-245]|uniref:ABC transporter permease n=1 Tax=Nocardioides sp. LHD-245 TaxID=3051387 RepID=UPI0027E10E0F|nr:ABC transporter permease [Nocardioides sp. LHD-245]
MSTATDTKPGAAQVPDAADRPPGRSGRRIVGSPIGIIVTRLLGAIPLLLAVTALTFVLIALAPGDVAQAILGPDATPAAYDQLREQLGLNLPLHEQYWGWLTGVLHGDVGTSLYNGESVSHAIAQRLPVTLSLMVGALIVSLVVGVALGMASAVRRGAFGRAIDMFALIGFAVPSFWLGAQLIVLFAVQLGWFPATGYVPLGVDSGEWARSLALPVAALAFGGIAAIAKQSRDAFLDALAQPFVSVALANGVSIGSILFRHVLKVASLRITTILGLQALTLLGGTVVVENVFSLPGLGTLAANATSRGDVPMIQGIVLYYAFMVVAVNLLVDIVYAWLNPRVRAA